MKKFFLSGAVIVSFFLYSLFERRNINPESLLTVPVPSSPISNSVSPTLPPKNNGTLFRDGTYTGDTFDAYYGIVQVEAVIQNGQITAVNFLQYPNDRGRSVQINSRAIPILQSEAIRAQKANVDIVSGATDTSRAFIASLQSALLMAK